jgi:phosphoglycolate phosphatase
MTERLTVIFDLDGTLVDTAPDLAAAMNRVLDRNGRGYVPLSRVRHMVGQGARVLMSKAMEETGEAASEEHLDELYDQFLDHYMGHLSDLSQPYPGAVEQIERCREQGYRLGICTNKPEKATLQLLEDLDLRHHFSAIVAGDTLAIKKPDPRHLLVTVRRAGGHIKRAVMVGDSENDILTATAAGMPVIAVTFGYTPQHVSSFKPTLTIDHFDEFWDAVQRFQPRRARDLDEDLEDV